MFYHIIANLFFLLPPLKKSLFEHLLDTTHHFDWFLLVFDAVDLSLF